MANSAAPDQLASSLFAKAGYIQAQHDKGKEFYKNSRNFEILERKALLYLPCHIYRMLFAAAVTDSSRVTVSPVSMFLTRYHKPAVTTAADDIFFLFFTENS